MLIRVLPDGRLEWLEANAGATSRASFEQWRENHADLDSVSLLVPGEDVLITEVEIAARQRNKLMQALPFAVEDQLVEEVDRYHYALGPNLAEDRYLAAAVLQRRMESWLVPFAEAGIRVDSVTADSQAVRAAEDAAVVVFDEGRVLLRTGPSEAYAVRYSEVEAFLTLAGSEQVVAYGRPPPSLELPETWQHLEAQQSALALLDRWMGSGTRGVELLQGEYAVGDPKRQRSLKLWRWAAVLLVLALLAETAGEAVEYFRRAGRLDALRNEAEDLLRGSFPEVQRVVDPRLQMAQELEARRGGVAGSGAGALYLLQLAGPALTAVPEVRLESLTYRGGELLVEVRGDDLAQIEALRQRLGERRLRARIESATTLEDRATARIRIGAEA